MLSFVQNWFAPRVNPIGVDFGSDCLRLAHERNIAGRSLVPARGNADEGLVNLLGRQAHGVKIRAMGCPFGALRHMAAWQPALDARLGVHREPVPPAGTFWTRKISEAENFRANRERRGLRMISRRRVAK